MPQIAKLLKGYADFYQKYFIENPQIYQKLFADGQFPNSLIIACSDSRVDPSLIFNADPGDIFVVRNVANIVPPYQEDEISYHGTSAAIEYAVNHLKVQNVIILGHSHCGGIKSLMDDEENDHTFIDNWLYIVNDAKEKAKQHAMNQESNCEFCEKEAIRISMQNLLSFPFVKERVGKKELALHGWYFDLETGTLETIVKI